MTSPTRNVRALARAALVPCALFLFAAGCGDSGDPEDPADVADVELPPDAVLDLESWKGRLIKSCSLEEALPSLSTPDEDAPPPTPGVDLDMLGARYPGGVVSAGDQFVLLGEPRLGLTTWFVNSERRLEVNGAARRLRLASSETFGRCSMRVNDEVVFEGRIAHAVPVAADFDASKITDAEASVSLGVEPAVDGVAAVGAAALVAIALERLAPTAAGQQLVARALEIEPELASRLFPPVPASARAVPAARLATIADSFPFVPLQDGGRAYGSAEAIEAFVSTLGVAQVELLFPSPALIHGAVPGHTRLVVTEGLRPASRAPAPSIEARVRVDGVSVTGPVVASPSEATACFRGRHDQVRRHFAQYLGSTGRVPFDIASQACAPLTSDLTQAIADDPASRELVRGEATRLGYTELGGYEGWDGIFSAVAQRLAEDAPALVTFMNPGGGAGPEQDALARIDEVRAASTGQPEHFAAFVVAVLTRMFEDRALDAALVAEVAAAIRNVGAAYASSTRRMIDDLGRPLDEESARAAARCGAGLDGERRAAIDRLLAMRREHESFVLWTTEAEAIVLQSCWSSEDVRALEASAQVMLSFVREEDRARGDNRSLTGNDVSTLVTRGMDERWTEATIDTLGLIVEYGAKTDLRRLCAAPSRGAVALCIGGPMFSAAAGQGLDPAFEGRYGRLAARIQDAEAGDLGGTEGFAVRSELDQAFFSVIFGRCPNEDFDRRVEALFASIEGVLEADGLEVFDAQTRFREALQDCTTTR